MKKLMLLALFVCFNVFANTDLDGYIAGKTFRMTSLSAQGRNIPIEPCSADDDYIFHANGTYAYNINTSCGGDDQNTTGTWQTQSYDNGSHYLVLVDQTEGEIWAEFVALDNSSMTLKFMQQTDDGGQVEVTAVFSVR